MSSDSDAVPRLEAAIAEAEALQARMKAANSAIRELLKPDFCERIGFPDYRLANHGANLRRLRERLEAVSQAQATPDAPPLRGSHATLADCPAENRVRLFFPGKPAEAVRGALKTAGFRWAPSLACWQTYRNERSLAAARRFAGIE